MQAFWETFAFLVHFLKMTFIKLIASRAAKLSLMRGIK